MTITQSRTAIKSRSWDGELLRPTNWNRPHREWIGDQCDDPDPDRCSLCNTRLVHVSIKTADGRQVTAYLTPDQADEYADQLKLQAELARG